MVKWHPTGELAPPTAYVDEPTLNIFITVVDENMHSFAFYFAAFLEIWLNLNLNLLR